MILFATTLLLFIINRVSAQYPAFPWEVYGHFHFIYLTGNIECIRSHVMI